MKQEKRVHEGFEINLEKGKVPFGHFTFAYFAYDKPNSFLVNSAEQRGMKAVDKGEYVLITGKARDHDSLTSSLISLGVDGKVIEGDYMEKTTKNAENIIEIQEDVRLPNSNIILEKGDKIRFIENVSHKPQYEAEFYNLFHQLVPQQGTSSTLAGELLRAVNYIFGQVNRNGRYNFIDWAPYQYLSDMVSIFRLRGIKNVLTDGNLARTNPSKFVADIMDATYLEVTENERLHTIEPDDMFDGYPHDPA